MTSRARTDDRDGRGAQPQQPPQQPDRDAAEQRPEDAHARPARPPTRWPRRPRPRPSCGRRSAARRTTSSTARRSGRRRSRGSGRRARDATTGPGRAPAARSAPRPGRAGRRRWRRPGPHAGAVGQHAILAVVTIASASPGCGASPERRWAGRPIWLLVLAAIGGALLVIVATTRWAVPSDEHAYWLAARRIIDGLPLYDPAATIITPYAYLYPPPLAQAMVPVALVLPSWAVQRRCGRSGWASPCGGWPVGTSSARSR